MQRIGGDPEGFSISSIHFRPLQYREELLKKVQRAMNLYKGASALLCSEILAVPSGRVDVIPSPPVHCRQRCRFALAVPAESQPVSHEPVYGNTAAQALSSDHNNALVHMLWDNGWQSIIVEHFPIAALPICVAMPQVTQQLNDASAEILRDGVQAVSYFSTLSGQLLIVLIYADAALSSREDQWRIAAAALRDHLQHTLADEVTAVSVVGRSKRCKIVCGDEYLTEEILIPSKAAEFSLLVDRMDEVIAAVDCGIPPVQQFRYRQVADEGFSNPNAAVNARVLRWLCDAAVQIRNFEDGGSEKKLSLVELFSGNGNHTVALADYFDRVIAVEINPRLCVSAQDNLRLNGITNATVVQADAEIFSRQLLTDRAAAADVVLVDPPRCGLDKKSLQLLFSFKHVLYVSCSPQSLARDLNELLVHFRLQRMSVADHFAYTPHLETIVWLTHREESAFVEVMPNI